MLGILAAALSGLLMSVQGVCNTGVSKSAGLWTTGAFVSLTAGAVCLCIRLFAGQGEGGFSALSGVQPRYLLLGGLFGALITGTVVFSISRLGTARAELVIVVAQLITAYGISVFGLLRSEQEPFSWGKLAALCTAHAGVIWYSL
ncbi:MAG: DMT family transporter [Oscillospiraceae bacterium]|nr:DMT family transporter [Oscillospiraceae bacterium]